MSENSKAAARDSLPLATIWTALLAGDPGPALSFVDALIENDLPFAAGGFLQDLAERLNDAQQTIDDQQKLAQFVEAAEQTLLHACDGDQAMVAQIREQTG